MITMPRQFYGQNQRITDRGLLVDFLDGGFDFLHHTLRQGGIAELGGHLLSVCQHPLQEIGDDLSFLWILRLLWNQ